MEELKVMQKQLPRQSDKEDALLAIAIGLADGDLHAARSAALHSLPSNGWRQHPGATPLKT